MAAFIDIQETPSAGVAGHIAASSKGYTGSTLVRIADENLNAGLGVVAGATLGLTCKAPESAEEVEGSFEGVTIDPEYTNEIGAAADYLDGQQVSILEEGYIWVIVEEAVAVYDPVFCRHTASGGNTTLGAFRNDADTDTAAAVAGAKFITATSGAGVAKIRLAAK